MKSTQVIIRRLIQYCLSCSMAANMSSSISLPSLIKVIYRWSLRLRPASFFLPPPRGGDLLSPGWRYDSILEVDAFKNESNTFKCLCIWQSSVVRHVLLVFTWICHRKSRVQVIFSPRTSHDNVASPRLAESPCASATYKSQVKSGTRLWWDQQDFCYWSSLVANFPRWQLHSCPMPRRPEQRSTLL